MIALAALAGLLLGSSPTADWIARRSGIDLRSAGSGNPGTNNARRLAGYRLAVPILVVELGKGAGAVILGSVIAGSAGAAAAGVTAVLGNVANPWFGLRGGQGLAITGGVLVAAWPEGFLLGLGVIALVTAATRSSPAASLAALASVLGAAASWELVAVDAGWSLTEHRLLLAAGIAVVIAPKQLRKAAVTLRSPARGESRRAR